MTSSTVGEFASGDHVTSSDYISGRGSDVDEVIFVEGPYGEGRDHVELPAVDVYSPAPVTAVSTSASRQFQLTSTTTTHRPRTKSRTPGHRFRERTSSKPTSATAVSSDNEPAPVKSKDEDKQGSAAPHYMALAVNVALLAGIFFVVAVFLAVLVSFVIYQRRQCRQDVGSTPTSTGAAVVSRPRIKPACDGFSPATKHAPTSPPSYKPRLFVSVSKVGDPKEWFV